MFQRVVRYGPENNEKFRIFASSDEPVTIEDVETGLEWCLSIEEARSLGHSLLNAVNWIGKNGKHDLGYDDTRKDNK